MSAATEALILCPLCDYDLRGQLEPRCPECGYHFDWEELRDPTRRLHPYLFEHHPERPIRSLRRTYLASLRPRRFWSNLFPTQAPSRRRLIAYWATVALLLLVPAILQWAHVTHLTHHHNARWRAGVTLWSAQDRASLVQQFGSVEHYLDTVSPILPSWRVPWNAMRRESYGLFAICIITWPWMTFAALMIFRASMRKAQIKPIHVLRCLIYSADAMILLSAATIGWTAYKMRAKYIHWDAESNFTKQVLLIAFCILSYRLIIAYRRYLRFDHAIAVVVSSQVIVALALWKFGLDADMLRW